MEDILSNCKNIHFLGIGGSGMAPIVQILKKMGYNITGSDCNESDVVRFVRSLGVNVYMNQRAENIKGADLLIYTSAMLEDNEEFVAAKKSNVKLIERNDFLDYFTSKYDNCICVCGTHGKTTTTSIITTILLQAKKSPSAIIGGKLNIINGYSILGSSQTLVCEACEHKDHFLKLHPDIAVVLNIDNDHLDYFKNVDNIKNSFKRFCEQTRKTIIYNGDDLNTKDALKNINKKTISYGFNSDNDYYVTNINKKEKIKTTFSVYRKSEKIIDEAEILIPGKHNILNALAAIVVAMENDIAIDDILKGLKSFKGACRRFEFIGKANGATVLDDYAHHPKEIYETLKALKEYEFNRIFVVHQPFTFSRTAILKDDFKTALSIADEVIITDILGSREKNEMGVSSKDLADIIPNSVYIGDQTEAANYVLSRVKEDDVVITMGCGDIYKCAKTIVYGKW